MIVFVRAILVLAFVLSLVSGEVMAHTPGGLAGDGFFAGFVHPFGGLDHLLAALAAGVWISRLGRRTSVIVLLAILVALGLGLAVGLGDVPVPADAGIVASLLALGAALLFDLRPLSIAAAAAAGFFAFFHGHAHGAEMPALANPATYATGLGVASILLMIVGWTLARGFRGRPRRILRYRQMPRWRGVFARVILGSKGAGSSPGAAPFIEK